MKQSYLKLPFIIFLTFFLTNCASIVSDATQVVSVETPNCKGAKCRMTNSEGVFYIQSTPGSSTIQKAYGDLIKKTDNKPKQPEKPKQPKIPKQSSESTDIKDVDEMFIKAVKKFDENL